MKRLALLLFVLTPLFINAQFLQGVGVMGGITWSKQKWKFKEGVTEPEDLELKRILRFNGCLFAEFINSPYVRWRTEIQYNQKGTKEILLDQTIRNKTNYLCWNNFLVLRTELYSIVPYILFGPRVEYLLSSSPQSGLQKLHITASGGAGIELVTYGNWKPMIEAHYNPDITKSYKSSIVDFKHDALELRVGIKYTFSSSESCPPVYR